MVAYAQPEYISPEEYLLRERDAKVKSEYWDGVLVAMAGGSEEHDYICGDLYRHLGNRLEGSACTPFTGNMSVHIPAFNRYVYPDVSVACTPQFTGIEGHRVLVNPVLVAEVLSPSTQQTDVIEKQQWYRSLPSLQVYLLVSQSSPSVNIILRQESGEWASKVVSGLDAVLRLPLPGCDALPLSDLYRRVAFALPEMP
jgi:Uma2 family endonuclease